MNIEHRSKELATGFVKQAALSMQGLGNFIRGDLYKDLQNSVNSEAIKELLLNNVPKHALIGSGVGAGIGGLIPGIKGYRAAEGSMKDRLKAGLRKSLRGAGIGAGLGTGAGLLSGIDEAAGTYADEAFRRMGSGDLKQMLVLGDKVKDLDLQYKNLADRISAYPKVGGEAGLRKLFNRQRDIINLRRSFTNRINESWGALRGDPYASRTLIEGAYPGLLDNSNWTYTH